MNAQRIPSIELSAADETTKRNFEKLTARIGRVPNMPRAMAQSPAALKGWMSLLEALAKGLLSKKLAAELALALAGINHCQYCASSHTVLSKFAGLNDAQIVNALEGKVEDSKDAAAVLLNRKCYLKMAFALALLGLLAFTGCASVRGTSDNNNPANNHVATYIDQKDSSPVSCCR
jgi:AhpD family alkylhydroperoxidase